MPNVWTIILPVGLLLLAGVGFLLRRWLFGGVTQERVSISSTAAEMLGRMREHGFTLEDVRTVENYLRGKAYEGAGSAASPNEAEGVVFENALLDEPDFYWTSGNMNARALASFRTADARLDELATELITMLEADEAEGFVKAQRAWKLFRERQARFASFEAAGGTLQTLIHAAEAQDLSEKRAAELQAEIERRRRS